MIRDKQLSCKKICCIILCFLCPMVLGCEDGTAPPKKTIRFAFQDRIGSAIPIVAVAQDLFRKEGITVQPLRFSSGPACAEALYSGSADIATMGDSTAIIAIARHPQLKIMASHCTGEHRHRLIVRGTSSFQSLKDLRSKRIGIKLGTSTYGGFLAALSDADIPVNEMIVMDLSPGTMPEALMAGSVDAIAASEPTPSLAELQDGRQLATFGGLGNLYPILMVAQSDFLKKNELEIRRFIQALKAAEIFVHEYPDETSVLLSKTTGLPLDVTREAMKRHDYRLSLDESILKSLRKTARFLTEHQTLPAIPDLTSAVEYRYLDSRSTGGN
jgi:ABC-type nitrate/sulfonate/bicarbonate transport system substrate-binding protein